MPPSNTLPDRAADVGRLRSDCCIPRMAEDGGNAWPRLLPAQKVGFRTSDAVDGLRGAKVVASRTTPTYNELPSPLFRLLDTATDEPAEEYSIQATETPYLPSWIDRFIGWIERLPGPVWLFYLLAGLVLALSINLVFWIDGMLPVGLIDPYNTAFALVEFYWLALYHYLTSVGSRSLRSFRPLLAVQDPEFRRIDFELGSLPRGLGLLSIPLGFGFAAASIIGDPAPYGNLVPHSILPVAVDMGTTGFVAATFFCLLIRSVRQLLMVRKLHERATNINLLNLKAPHAFSALTARTAIGVILIFVIIYLLDPASFASALGVTTYLVTVALALAIFVLPVLGMQDKLEEEKGRLLTRTSDLLQIANESLHSKVVNKDFSQVKDMESAIAALIRERELFTKVSTWPFDPRAIRGFGSALLLPIFLWLVTRLLDRIL
jgi:hypothetical protein